MLELPITGPDWQRKPGMDLGADEEGIVGLKEAIAASASELILPTPRKGNEKRYQVRLFAVYSLPVNGSHSLFVRLPALCSISLSLCPAVLGSHDAAADDDDVATLFVDELPGRIVLLA